MELGSSNNDVGMCGGGDRDKYEVLVQEPERTGCGRV
jgi:hypothetical protein